MIKGEYRGASLGWLVVILVALGIWALVWGPDGDDGEETPATSVGNTDGPLIRASLPYDNWGEYAEVGGTLLLRDGCLLFEYGPDAEFAYVPIVWPGGTSWDAAAEEVVLPDGARIGVGDEVTGGGGYPNADALGWLDEDAQALAQRCADSEWNGVARFNNQANAARPAD